MTDYFVDGINGSNSNNGLTMDSAWATTEYAMESGGLAAGDVVWIRRNVDESGDKTTYYSPAYDGTPGSPLKFIGWPRTTTSLTSADWTNGSTTVDNVVGATLSRSAHQARYITAPDGSQYLITEIIDSNTLKIEREYTGSTVTGTSGACTIQADSDYSTAQAIDDSAWTIKKSDWNGDSDTLPKIGFGTSSYRLDLNLDFNHEFRNIEFLDSDNTSGIVRTVSSSITYFEGCLFKNTQSRRTLYLNSATLKRCTVEGDEAYAYAGPYLEGCILTDCAIYSIYGYCCVVGSHCEFYNVNLNVEGSTTNPNGALYLSNIKSRAVCVDCKTGNGMFFQFGATGQKTGKIVAGSENHQKVLGAHVLSYMFGEITKTDVVAGSGDPYKRTGGADSVLECEFDTEAHVNEYDAPVVFEHEFEADTTSKTYRYYIQSEGAISSGDLWLEAQYVDKYDDTSEYFLKTATATGAIAARSDASDWSQYLEITVQPATASKVRIKCKCLYYHATNIFYIDPIPVIT